MTVTDYVYLDFDTNYNIYKDLDERHMMVSMEINCYFAQSRYECDRGKFKTVLFKKMLKKKNKFLTYDM